VLAETSDGKPGLLKEVAQRSPAVMWVSFTPNGKTGLLRYREGDSGLVVLDLVDYVMRPAPFHLAPSATGMLAVSPDGKRFAADGGSSVILYNAKTYKPDNPKIPLPCNCTAVAFSPDSNVVGTAEQDGKAGRIRFWGTEERNPLKKPIEMDEPAVSLAFSPDGQFVAVSNGSLANMNIVNAGDKKIFVYRYSDGALVSALEGHPKSVAWAAFFADGKRLFSASPYDGTLRVWNIAERKEAKPMLQASPSATNLGRKSTVKDPETMVSFTFWPWGRALTGHWDGSLKLWDVDTGELVKRFKSPSGEAHAHATALAISPDGHHALAAYNDSRYYLYRLPPPPGKRK
jgi:WD40 repeat protein